MISSSASTSHAYASVLDTGRSAYMRTGNKPLGRAFCSSVLTISKPAASNRERKLSSCLWNHPRVSSKLARNTWLGRAGTTKRKEMEIGGPCKKTRPEAKNPCLSALHHGHRGHGRGTTGGRHCKSNSGKRNDASPDGPLVRALDHSFSRRVCFRLTW